MYQLSDADFKILTLLKNVNKMHKNDIAESLKQSAEIIQGRLEALSKYKYVATHEKFVQYGPLSAFIDSEEYHLTDLGHKALEDFYSNKRKNNFKIWEDRFWKVAPLIISIISLLKSYDFI